MTLWVTVGMFAAHHGYYPYSATSSKCILLFFPLSICGYVTEETQGGGTIYYYRMDPPLCSGGPPPLTRFALPATRERHLSVPDIGEKERDYLFKELYKLKSNNLMSSLKSQNPLEYPQTHSPSFPLCPVRGTMSQKKK